MYFKLELERVISLSVFVVRSGRTKVVVLHAFLAVARTHGRPSIQLSLVVA